MAFSVSVKQAFLCWANTFSVLRVRWGDLKGVEAAQSGDHNSLRCKALEVDLVVERSGHGIFCFRKTGVFVLG